MLLVHIRKMFLFLMDLNQFLIKWYAPLGSIVLDGPSALRSQEAIQLLQAVPTCLVTCHVTQLLTCSAYQVTDFRKLVVFKKNRLRTQKERTVGDVDQQTVQRGILNRVPESNIATKTCQSCGSSSSMMFPPHELVQVRG